MTVSQQSTVTLNDGVRMPQLGLGVWQTPPEQAAAVVADAVAAGYKAVDTAAGYDNEEGVGEALAGQSDVFLTTKLRNDDQGFDQTLKAFDTSAAKLKRDKVDLYLIHWPSPWRKLYLESWKALVRLKEEGRIVSVGVSNFTEAHLKHIIDETGVTPVLNQIELHPRFQQRALRAFHDTVGIKTESWSPLGQGKLLEDATLGAIAEKHGKSPAQVIIRWHLDNDLIVIPKSVNAERLRQNLDVFDFKLDGDDLARIAALDSRDGRIGPDPMTAKF